jgi:methyltransferase
MNFHNRCININVAIPSSSLIDEKTLRDKTIKISRFARAFSIFGVKKVFIYNDNKLRQYSVNKFKKNKHENDINVIGDESNILKLILEYLDTPQYLRKALYPICNELKFAGLLDPIKSPHHKKKIPLEQIKEGELRIGILVNKADRKDFSKLGVRKMDNNSLNKRIRTDISFKFPNDFRTVKFWHNKNKNQTDMYVDIGLDYLIPFYGNNDLLGQRVDIKIIGKYPNIKAVQAFEKDLENIFWGYKVSIVPSLDHIFRQEDKNTLILLTSRKGGRFKDNEARFKELITHYDNLLIVFGSPTKGLDEIYPNIEQLATRKSCIYSNLFPNQHTETIRLEEAVLGSLSILNYLLK